MLPPCWTIIHRLTIFFVTFRANLINHNKLMKILKKLLAKDNELPYGSYVGQDEDDSTETRFLKSEIKRREFLLWFFGIIIFILLAVLGWIPTQSI